MGEIILLKKYQDMKQKKRESSEDIAALLSHMASEVSKIQDKSGIEMMAEREIQERKRFEKRYKDVLSQAPDSAEAQLQYFAGIMLGFLPIIFHGEQKDRFDAYIDFSEFYLSEFDMAYSQYRNVNQEYEKEYPFRFSLLEANALEKKLQDCFQQIIFPSPAKSSRERAENIMWQACRLFELYHCLDDLFLKKKGSVLNFVSMVLNLIPEVGCGQSPRSLVNTGYFADS